VVAPQSFAASQTRTSAFEYDPATGLLTKEIIEPDNPNLCLVTTYGYDAFANKVSATTANCAGASGDAVIAPRTRTTSFAPAAGSVNGRFPGSSSNALNHTEIREFAPKHGGVTKLTGPNGLVTTWTYDDFGRKTGETRADGTSTTWTYTLCGICPQHGKYFVTETTSGAPTRKVYFDALNREIRSEVQGFGGTAVYKDTQYDSLGRVAQVSRPYLSSGTVNWTTFQYDILGRVTQSDEPAVDGMSARTLRFYAGLWTTVTVSNGGFCHHMPGDACQIKMTARNSQGQVVEVRDPHANTVGYAYDPFGNLIITSAGGVSTTLSYDLRGRKTGMVDPDMGSWSYAYNALGELVRQTDAKGQVTTMAYDVLGRMSSRTEPDLVSTWTYDACTKGVGKLCSVSSDNGYARSHGYDSLGRPSTLSVTLDTVYSVGTTYDSAGRVDTLTYPTGFAVKHLYDDYGYLHKVQSNDGTPTVFWQANSQNAAGQVTSETLGNGLTATRSYDALFRLTAASASDGASTPHSQTFGYDTIGNLTQRVDATQAVTENFAYDGLNRLASVSGPGLITRSFDYSALGNLTYKSDVGNYSYPGIGLPRPHAVSSVGNGGAPNSVTATYAYDANGNLTGASGTIYPASGAVAFSRTLSYTSFNAPNVLTHVQGGSTYSYTYTYNAEHERVRLVTARPSDTLTTIYVHPAGKGALLYEKESRQSDGLVEHKHYVNGGAGLVGVYVTKSSYGAGEGPQMRYYHKDHLGSIAVITNPAGAVIERLAYEAFGERRYPSGAPEDRASPLIGVTTDRGFTAHEHLDEMMLVHMNGRIYDPLLGRFLTPDPFVQAPGNLQSYNRYSYGFNDPLSGVDPNGYGFLDDIFDAVDNILDNPNGLVGLGLSIFLGPLGPWPTWAGSSFTTALAGGFIGGVVATGSFEGGIQWGLTAGAFDLIGGVKGWGTFERVLAHGAVGCVSASISGGSCGSGAIAAGFAKFASAELLSGVSDPVAKGIVVAAIGGTASVLGGGKFANGAATAAFGYLFSGGFGEAGASEALSTDQASIGGADYCQGCGGNVDPDGFMLVSDEGGPRIVPITRRDLGRLGTSLSKWLERSWEKSTFPDWRGSLTHHYNKHVVERGRDMNIIDYTRAAQANWSNPNAVRAPTVDALYRPAVEVRSSHGWGVYTPRGKIITFEPSN
jgi:RHS repeat-associated protein